MKRTIATLVVSAIALLGSAPVAVAEPVQASAMEKTVAKVQPSIVFLDIEWTGWVYDERVGSYMNNADPYVLNFSCTGFVIDPEGYIGTAGHCVDPAEVESVFLAQGAQELIDRFDFSPGLASNWATAFFHVEGQGSDDGVASDPDFEVQAVWSTSSTEPVRDESTGDLNGTPYAARVIEVSGTDEGDTALLKVEAPEALPALPLAADDEIATGDDVISVGYPGSVGDVTDATLSNPSFKAGTVSSVRTSGGFPVYETNAALSGGMSGGPTVNLQGEVIGINSFTIVDEVESFDFIQSVATLDEVLGSAGVDAQVGEPGTSYRAGLTAYWAGDKEEAVTNLTTATTTSSDFEMADEYLRKAQALPDPASPIIPIAIGGVVLLALAGGLFFLVNRRKRNKGTPIGPTVTQPLPVPVIPAVPVMPAAPISTPDGQARYAVIPDKPL